MSPFDIMLPRAPADTPEGKEGIGRELADARYFAKKPAAKRGANPKVAPPKPPKPKPPDPWDPRLATTRERNWKVGQYVPSTQMREAVERARAEQPPLISLAQQEEEPPC